jgi:polysaccharide biosynthesis transport protein
VLLIDGDLRHPSVSRYFGLETNNGLVDFLTGVAPFEEAVLRLGGVTVLPAGSKSQNPPDLLGSDRMRLLVEKLRAIFDYIIIDSPPLGPVIDGRVLGQLADKVIFIVRWQMTTREMVAQNVDYFVRAGKLAGIALNLVDEAKVSRYGAYTQYSDQYYKKYYQN